MALDMENTTINTCRRELYIYIYHRIQKYNILSEDIIDENDG
jgi:hypothetical protein